MTVVGSGILSSMGVTGTTQITDKVDSPHTGLFKALHSMTQGNLAIDLGATDASGAFGFSHVYTWVNGVPFVTVQGGEILHEGKRVTVADGSTLELNKPTAGAHYHWITVSSAGAFAVTLGTSDGVVPAIPTQTIPISLIKSQYDSTGDLATQFFTTSKQSNSVSIAYDNSNEYAEKGSLTASASGLLVAGTTATIVTTPFMSLGNGAVNAGALRLLEDTDNGAHYTGFKAPAAVTANTLYTLPADYPASNKILQSTDAGILSWETAAAASAVLTGSTNNTITTVTGSNAIQGEANLTFDGSTLEVTGALTTTTTATIGTDLTVTGGDITYGNSQNATLGLTATAHNVAGKPLSISAGTTTAATTNDIAGGSLTIKGGQGKGTGSGGDIIFQTANAAGGSAHSLNALATALTLSDDLSATFTGGITSTTVSNTLGATSFNDANITNVGDIALDSISSDASLVTINAPSEVANGASGGATALLIDNDDTDEIALHIEAANIDANVIQINADALTSSHGVYVESSSLTTGSAISVLSDGTALTSTVAGGLVEIIHTGATGATVNNLLYIKNDHASASGTNPLYVENDGYGAVAVFKSNGTNNDETLSLVTTDADANGGPILELFRDSASPAVADVIGVIDWQGRDDGGNKTQYAYIAVAIGDEDNTDEWSTMDFTLKTDISGTPAVGAMFRLRGGANGGFNTAFSGTSVIMGAGVVPPDANAAFFSEGAIALDEISAPTATADYGKIWTQTDNNMYFQDGAGTNTVVLKGGKHSIWVPSAAIYPSSTNGCSALTQVETTALRPDLKVLDFATGADEFAQFTVSFPKSWNEGTVTFQPFWTVTGTNTGTVKWELAGISVANDASINTVFGTQVGPAALAHSGTSNDQMVSAESGAVTITGAAADTVTYFQINRDVSDTQTGDARLLGVKVFYDIDAGNDE